MGHSTSGSHERYKSRERLDWEKEYDPIRKMREWILTNKIAAVEILDEIEKKAIDEVRAAQQKAWEHYIGRIKAEREELIGKSPVDLSPDTQPDGINSLEKAEKLILQVLKGRPQFFEWRHKRKDGTYFDAEVTLNAIEIGN